MYPNRILLQRPIVASNNLVQQVIDCSKENEQSKKQDPKYLQPRWCRSCLSHTQKRRLQRMRKKEAMEQQVEDEPKTSAIMKMVWRPKQVVSTSTWLEQDMADNCLLPLAQKMADVMLIIALRRFWLRRMFFGKQALPKNRGHLLTAKISTNRSEWAVWPVEALWPVWQGLISLTGMSDRSDRSRRSPSQIRIFVDLDL